MTKNILIISEKAAQLEEALAHCGFSVLSADHAHFDDCLLDKDSAVILDLDADDKEMTEYIAELCRNRGSVVCAVSAVFEKNTAVFLKKNGIALYIGKTELIASPQSADLIGRSSSDEGIAVIAEDDPGCFGILEMIFSLFGYQCRMVKNEEELFASADGASFVVHNLNMHSVDLLTFVKRAAQKPAFKNVPYIAYKNGGDGVSLHDINCGIVRLTSYILSVEEVWSVLVYNLYRKEIFTRADALERHLKINDNKFFAQESMKKIFHSKDAKFFTSASRTGIEKHLDAAEKVRSLDETMAKMRMLSWLINDEQHVISAGV